MVRTFHANEFIKPADRGLNRPVILRGRTADDIEASIMVKTRAGYGDRPGAAGIELFATMLAREMEMNAPEPVLVIIPEGFERIVFGVPEHRTLIAESPGVNFGTVLLGTDWKTWPVGMSTRAFPTELIEDILAFDALVQHTDREADNPNLLWRDRQIAIVDHEKCFGNLARSEEERYPWRSFLGSRPLHRHGLRSAVRIEDNPKLGERIHMELLNLEMEERIPTLIADASEAFPQAELDLDRIGRYFEALRGNASDFIEYFRLCLRP